MNKYFWHNKKKTLYTAFFQFCKTSPYRYERVTKVNVTIGPDGTDDSVKVYNT